MHWLRLAALVAALAASRAGAVDMQQLTQDSQRMTTEAGTLSLVWWLPQQWWDAMLGSNPNLTAEGRAKVDATLAPYTIFALVHARGGLGTLDAATKADMLQHAKLEVAGHAIEPLAPDKVDAGAQALLAAMKPALAGVLGKLGQSIELVVYPNRDGDRTILDAATPGAFTYTFYEQAYAWRLPLGSVLPPKIDAKTGESFPGNYEFNPFTGERLQAK
jgi:hypothetical protein